MKKTFAQNNINKYIKLTQCYDQEYDREFEMEIHAHEGVEMMFVYDGRVSFIYEMNESREIMRLGVDEMVFFDSTIPHYIRIESPSARIFNFQLKIFDEPLYPYQRNCAALVGAEPVFQQLFKEENTVFKLYDDYGIVFTLKKLITTAAQYWESNYSVVDCLVQTILFEIINGHYNNEKTYRGYLYVKKAINFMENADERLSANEIAEKVGISYVYMHKLFKQCFGKGITEYFNGEYIGRACKIMEKHPELSVREIASICGFSGVRQFERCFKEITRTTPTKYRAQLNQSKLFYLRY